MGDRMLRQEGGGAGASHSLRACILACNKVLLLEFPHAEKGHELHQTHFRASSVHYVITLCIAVTSRDASTALGRAVRSSFARLCQTSTGLMSWRLTSP